MKKGKIKQYKLKMKVKAIVINFRWLVVKIDCVIARLIPLIIGDRIP